MWHVIYFLEINFVSILVLEGFLYDSYVWKLLKRHIM